MMAYGSVCAFLCVRIFDPNRGSEPDFRDKRASPWRIFREIGDSTAHFPEAGRCRHAFPPKKRICPRLPPPRRRPRVCPTPPKARNPSCRDRADGRRGWPEEHSSGFREALYAPPGGAIPKRRLPTPEWSRIGSFDQNNLLIRMLLRGSQS